MAAVFESYWASGDFVPYDADEFRERTVDREPRTELLLSPIEIVLRPFQERLLEQIELARHQGHHRNLLVAATGTGKTVMAAVDYARLRDRRCPATGCCSSLIARRSSTRACATFRHALRDAAFGELWVGGDRPTRFEHVFASIQSLNATGVDAHRPGPLRRRDRRRVPPRRGTLVRGAPRACRAARAARPDRDTGASRRSRRAPLLRRPHRGRAAPVGRDRPAVPRSIRLLRRPRRTRPARRPVEARARLRRRRAHERADRGPRVGAAGHRTGPPARSTDPSRDASARLLRQRRPRPVHGRAASADAGIPAIAIWGDSPHERTATGACATWPTGEYTSCSPSISSTRASTSPTSTRC